MLNKIGSSEHIWGRGSSFPADIDDAYEWLVNANDDVLELVEELVDEFQKEEGAVNLGNETNKENDKKHKVSFHLASVGKPQYQYKIVVDNANQPFDHVLLEKNDDGQRFIHPLVGSLTLLNFFVSIWQRV